MIKSQLFGHERGAFTEADKAFKGNFREADVGTLMLDEVGEMSPDLQPALLRSLQEGEVLPVGASKPVKVDMPLEEYLNE